MTQELDPTTPSPGSPRDDLAAYAIGATDRDEHAAVARLLAAEPSLRREAAEFAAAASLLNASVPRVEPPAALKGKILSAARASRPQPALEVLPSAAPRPPRRARDMLVFVASTAAVVLLFASVYLMSQLQGMRRLADQSADERRAMETAVAQLSGAVSSDVEMAVALLTSAESKRIELMDGAGSMRAMVVFAPGHSEALMVTHDLPSLGEDQVYQLWQIAADGTPVSVDVFDPTPDGSVSMLFTPPMEWQSIDAVGISVEPMGGSETPTTTPIAMGTME